MPQEGADSACNRHYAAGRESSAHQVGSRTRHDQLYTHSPAYLFLSLFASCRVMCAADMSELRKSGEELPKTQEEAMRRIAKNPRLLRQLMSIKGIHSILPDPSSLKK